MSVYRDDLAAARERIRALESELQSIQRSESTTLRGATHDIVTTSNAHNALALALVGALIVGFTAIREPVAAPMAAGVVLVGLLVLTLRGRSLVVRPNEVAVVQFPAASPDPIPPLWIGPGRVVHLPRRANVESLSLCAHPISWLARDVMTADDLLDIEMFAVVAVRRDEEGIERAVRTFGAGPIEKITQAALEEALRNCIRDTTSADLRDRDAVFRNRLRRDARTSLDDLGVKLVFIGTIEASLHDGKSHDGKSHDGKSHDGKSHDGKSHDGKSHDGKSHDGKRHEEEA